MELVETNETKCCQLIEMGASTKYGKTKSDFGMEVIPDKKSVWLP